MRTTTLILIAMLNTFLASAPAVAQPCDPAEVAKWIGDNAIDGFGHSVAVWDDKAIFGAFADLEGQDRTGSASVYSFDGSSWSFQQKLGASDKDDGDHFGYAVDIQEDVAVVGAPGSNPAQAGAVYVFRFDGSTWVEEAKLRRVGYNGDERFGSSVAILDDVILVGAPSDHKPRYEAGTAWVFRRVGSEWIAESRLISPDPQALDHFGESVALTHDRAIVGAPLNRLTGSAYVFRFDGTRWLGEAILRPQFPRDVDRFGSSLGVVGEVVLVGAPTNGDSPPGAVYEFRNVDNQWIEGATIQPADGFPRNRFGFAISTWENTALISAKSDDDLGEFSGSAYVFRRAGAVWTEVSKILPSDGQRLTEFGFALAVSRNGAFVGVPVDDDGGEDAGAVYQFDLNCDEGECLTLIVDNMIAGHDAFFTISRGTPGARAVTLYGLQVGETVVDDLAGYCATFGIDGVTLSRVIGGFDRTFDAGGVIQFSAFVPPNAAGRTVYFQAAERGTCPDECMSNLVELVVQ